MKTITIEILLKLTARLDRNMPIYVSYDQGKTPLHVVKLWGLKFLLARFNPSNYVRYRQDKNHHLIIYIPHYL